MMPVPKSAPGEEVVGPPSSVGITVAVWTRIVIFGGIGSRRVDIFARLHIDATLGVDPRGRIIVVVFNDSLSLHDPRWGRPLDDNVALGWVRSQIGAKC